MASADLENLGLVDLQKLDLADYLQKLGQQQAGLGEILANVSVCHTFNPNQMSVEK